jgi:hypothetical protein
MTALGIVRGRVLVVASATARAALRTSLTVLVAITAFAPPEARAQICLAPTGVSASDGTNCSNVIVSWGGGNHGDTFKVYRAATDPILGNATLIGQTSLSTLTDSQAQSGVTYWYWVQKLNSTCPGGSSLAGPESGFIGTPPAPTGVVAADQTSCESVHLSWNPIPVAAFTEIWRSTTANVNTASILVVVNGSSFDDASAVPGTTYFYFVRGIRGGCIGPFQPVAESGGRKKPVLPDLVPVTSPFLGAPQVIVFSDGHAELFFESIVANVGTAAFDYEPKRALRNGTFEFGQNWVDACTNGRIRVNTLGASKLPTAQDPTTFPHFLRATLRNRDPGDVPGESRAILDLPSNCVRDGDAYFAGLPGSPASPQYTGCTDARHGLSIGWGTKTSLGDNGQRLHLHCVPSGDYFLEFTVDPEDVVEELDETNNTARVAISLMNLPAFDPAQCPAPAIDARLLGPDSLAAIAGAPADTFKVRVWTAGVSEDPGPPAVPHVQIGFALRNQFNRAAASGTDPWTWVPATWLSQDGPFDVWGGMPVVPNPGEYFVTFRIGDLDGHLVVTDRTGTNDGLQFEALSLLSVRTTTGVGDGAAAGSALALEALSNAAARSTRFRIELPEAAGVTVALYDVRGRRVRTLAQGPRDAGVFVLEWDGRDEGGRVAPPGVYLARLDTSRGGRLATKFFAITP